MTFTKARGLENSAAARANLGITSVGEGVLTATTAAAAREALGMGGVFSMRNKIINGKMDISQRGTSFSGVTATTYTVDRFAVSVSGGGVVTVSQQSDVPSSNEFQNSLRVAVTTADTSIAAGDSGGIQQRIEGYNVRDLIDRTFTLSFWVRSSKTGTHCVSLLNSGNDRSYVAEYTINSANTWEYKTITVSGGLITAGSWNWTNGVGLIVVWTLAAGTNLHTTANSWQTGIFLATANQVNCLDSNTNIFAITGVQLEVGAVATPFEHRPFGTELVLCQRYYYRLNGGVSSGFGVGYVAAATTAQFFVSFPTQMRIAPSALEQSGTANDYSVAHGATATACSSVPTYGASTDTGARFALVVASGLTTGQAAIARFNATAYLGWSAEL